MCFDTKTFIKTPTRFIISSVNSGGGQFTTNFVKNTGIQICLRSSHSNSDDVGQLVTNTQKTT